MLDNFFGTEPNVGAAYITPNKTIASESAKERLRMVLETPGVPIRNLHISGWSYTLANLIPWSKVKLVELSVVMIAFNIVLLIFLYRKVLPLLILMLSLFLSIGAMVATLKLFAIPLNLFNVLAFPLVLGVGVDYGIYILLAVRQPGNRELAFATILKPVFLSGLTAVCGFGSLAFARNPSLRGSASSARWESRGACSRQSSSSCPPISGRVTHEPQPVLRTRHVPSRPPGCEHPADPQASRWPG